MKKNKSYLPKHLATLAFVLPLLLLTLWFSRISWANTGEIKVVRVGLFKNKPMCYRDKFGRPSGIFIAVLQYTAAREGWELHYIDDSWSKQRAKLQNGKIDILPSMAVSKERQKLYTFNKTDIFTNWAEVYVRPKSTINSLLALKNKRVAASKKGIYTTGPEGILKIDKRFKLHIVPVLVDSYTDALIAVQQGRADAGVVNRLTGAVYEKELGLKKSGIVFSPVAIRFAFNKKSPLTPLLLAALDRHFADLREDNNSVYYREIAKALGGNETRENGIPMVVMGLLLIAAGLLILLFSFTYLLRRQVSSKTEALRESNEKLAQSEQQFRRLIESTSTVPWELDLASSKFTYMGDQIENILGYDTYSWVDLDIWAERLHEEDRDEAVQFCEIETKKGIDHEFIYRAIHKDGSIRWIQDVVSVVKDNKGTPIQLIGFMHDISESKTMAMEKAKLESILQQTQKMEAIGTLAGGIAHDFNNILGAILGYADMAREVSVEGSTIASDLDRVLAAGYRAKDLVKQILAFSRQAEEDKILLQPAPLIKETLKMLRPSLPSTIQISRDIAKETGFILASPTQIHQIIMNLCTNAFHAMEETGGKLHIGLTETTFEQEELDHETGIQPGRFVKLSICDSGTGIPPEIKDKVFEPYFTTKELGKGTGMGLSIVHGIVKSYGGFISLYSEPGEGCAFHIFLPIVERAAAIEEPGTVKQHPHGNERILFIDDEEMLTEMGLEMLQRLGYQVTARSSSLEALETFQNQPDQFDLVITDQTMPGITGADLARRLLQIRPDIPIILCTGYSTIISEKKAKEIGIKEFILKPLVKNDLAVIVRKVLDKK